MTKFTVQVLLLAMAILAVVLHKDASIWAAASIVVYAMGLPRG